MSTTTDQQSSNGVVGTAVEAVQTGPMATIEQYRGDFALVLPSHVKPETWVRLAQGALRRNADLMTAATQNVGSLLVALLDAARLGLEPGTEQYYLTPRKVQGKWEVLGVRGYQGEIELIYRAGAVSSVIVEVVRENDTFTYTPGRDERPVHEIDWKAKDRGALALVYAYAVMKDGATSKVVVLNTEHIASAKASSPSASSQYSPWNKHPEAMWMKTAVHRLTKWIPTSAEYRKEIMRTTAAAEQVVTAAALPPVPASTEAGEAERVDHETGEIYEAEIVEGQQ